MITARLYARVSTADQEEKYGLDAQLFELRAYAAKLGYQVADEYHDAITGENDSRPALDKLIGEAKADEVVLLHHPDRLSRGGVGPQFLIERELQRHGAQVDYLSIPRGSQDESAWRLQKEILGSIAAYERAQIKARTTRGRNEKARQGKIVAGTAPYGYRVQSDQYVIEEGEAATVRLMYKLCGERQISTRAISKELDRLGIPAARGGKWRRNVVHDTLANPTYKGSAFFNTTKKSGPRWFLPGIADGSQHRRTSADAPHSRQRSWRARSTGWRERWPSTS